MTSQTDIDIDIPARRDGCRRAPGRAWTWAGTTAAATLAAVLLAPAPLAAAASQESPFALPCQSQIQAFYGARQAVVDHNAEPHVFPTPEQVGAYDAQGRALFDAQSRAQQVALSCVGALMGRRAPDLPSPVSPTSPTHQPSSTRQAPTEAPTEAPDDEGWVEEMQHEIYDWYNEQLEKVARYQEEHQAEQRHEQQQHCAPAPGSPGSPADGTARPPTTDGTDTPAPSECPVAPTTTPSGVPH